MDFITNTLPTLKSLPQPFSSLNLLLQAEEEDSRRVRPSKLGWWVDVRRLRGSAIGRIWRAVTIVTLWSMLVAVAEFSYGKQLGLTNNVTPLLSVVVGLLLVFRNSTAYARWDEGRKAFGNMTSIVRSLSRSIWINVGASTPTTGRPDVSDKDHRAKITALRLLVAFVVATKRHVRSEFGVDYEDLASILPSKFLDSAGTTGYGYGAAEADANRSPTGNLREGQAAEFDRLSAEPASIDQPQSPGTIPRFRHLRERTPLLHRECSTDSAVILSNYLSRPSLPLPLLISHQLHLYFALCKKKGLLESIGPAGYNGMATALSQLIDNFTTIERLANIGIPTVYGIHLKQCVSLFLFTLPFTLVEIMGWKMVPFVSLCAFTLMGIEGIASEIEQPFGADDSDLPLDLIAAELRNEVEHIISRLSTHSEEWM